MYRPTVRATLSGIQEFENRNALFFGSTASAHLKMFMVIHNYYSLICIGSSMFPPSKLSRVCIGPSTHPKDLTQGRLNISWDPLPCHLQNGADIIAYTIKYTQL